MLRDKPLRNILFTFDYELFLGKRSGTVDNCLITPTNHLLEILDRFAFKGVFFIDTVYLVRLKDIARNFSQAQKDYDKIANQLKTIIENKHYLFTHLHPHWLDAQYDPDTNEWILSNTSKFSFNNLSEDDKNYIFDQSYNILKEIIYPVNPDYKIDGYRAGGLYIQPFSTFKPYFDKYGIKYDFSVFKGFSSFAENYSYDFTTTPTVDIYRFEDDITDENAKGSFIEFSISALEIKNVVKVLNSFWFRIIMRFLNANKWGDGLSSSNRITSKKRRNIFSTRESFSIELINSIKARIYLNYLKKHEFCHFITHPKWVSPYNLKVLEHFFSNIQRKYTIETDFKKMLSNL